MNIKLAITLAIGAFALPVASHAAESVSKDKPSVMDKAKENVSDAVITTKIKAEFAKDKGVSATNIKVDTDDKGVVTLSGNAKDKAEVDRALKIARDTKGVTSVKNAMVVVGGKTVAENVKEEVGDAVITTKIKAEFAKDKQVSALNVTVNTDNKGVVTLSGNAKSKAEADQAVKIARDTKGVSSVRNDIKVIAK
jgi:hyperosmotically inducible protein